MQQYLQTSLPKEASIHSLDMTAIKIVMREIQKREDMRWVMYTDSLCSMLAMKNNRENHPTLSKVPVHIGIKGNEETDKAAKQSIDMPRMITTRLPHADYYQTIGGLETYSGKGNGKTILASYTTLNHT